ncbi:hypothetical protein BTVI_135369 [Pitangus sulphuratus]|nr:hypothetical protein BTVI_135369 [Pitangus sulphuratus]
MGTIIACHTIADTSQDVSGLLGCLDTLMSRVQLALNQHHQVLFFQATFQSLFPQPVALHGVVVTQVRDLAICFIEPRTVDLSPSVQPVQIPLQSLPTLQQINSATQHSVICELTESTFDPLDQIISKDIKQGWSLEDATSDWLPTGCGTIHHQSLVPAIQPVFDSTKRSMSCHLPQNNAVGDSIKGLTSM